MHMTVLILLTYCPNIQILVTCVRINDRIEIPGQVFLRYAKVVAWYFTRSVDEDACELSVNIFYESSWFIPFLCGIVFCTPYYCTY